MQTCQHFAQFNSLTLILLGCWFSLTLTPFGLRENAYSLGLVDSQLTLDALFRQG
ncbi:MAG: hypothetical protein NW241_15555 [Bacteroidia bacterium]|nr:hypothetical protein [Bacteroidia bacterium]